MAEAIAIADLLPHQAPMALLDELLEATDDVILCRTTVRGDGMFDSDAAVPAFVGVEYMAQAIAAYSGLERYREGKPIRVGFLLGTRRFESSVASFPVGAELEVRAEKLLRGNNGMASFACSLRGPGIEQSATLSVFEPSETDAAAMMGENDE